MGVMHNLSAHQVSEIVEAMEHHETTGHDLPPASPEGSPMAPCGLPLHTARRQGSDG